MAEITFGSPEHLAWLRDHAPAGGTHGPQLTPAQQAAIVGRMAEIGATSYVANRDEPHDEHVFVLLFAGTRELAEVVVEGDGTFAGE